MPHIEPDVILAEFSATIVIGPKGAQDYFKFGFAETKKVKETEVREKAREELFDTVISTVFKKIKEFNEIRKKEL